MKHTWLVGILTSALLSGSVATQAQEKPAPKPATPAQEKPAPQPTKPAQEKPAPREAMPAQEKPAPRTTTPGQGQSAARGEVPTGELVLGTVSIPRTVTADGKTLARGTYTVRLTAQAAQPTVAGQLPDLNRWVEFVQGGTVRGREVVSIVPADEVSQTMPGPDMPGRVGRTGARVEMLKGGEYLRVWIARQGIHYLIHLPPSAA